MDLSHPLVIQCAEGKAGISVVIETLNISKDVVIIADAELKDDATVSADYLGDQKMTHYVEIIDVAIENFWIL